jgi:putative tricarboxylic transport membrane protein
MNRSFDRWASILFVLVGVFFILASRNLSETAYGSGVGPNIFPFGLGIILVILSIRLFYETFQYKDNTSQEIKLDWKKFSIILITTVLYICLLEWFGYVLCTFLFLVTVFQVMERGKWLFTILIAGIFSGGVYYVYVHLLEGTLPAFPLF